MIDFPFIEISFEYPNCRSTIGFLFENMTGKEYKMESDFWTSEPGYTARSFYEYCDNKGPIWSSSRVVEA